MDESTQVQLAITMAAAGSLLPGPIDTDELQECKRELRLAWWDTNLRYRIRHNPGMTADRLGLLKDAWVEEDNWPEEELRKAQYRDSRHVLPADLDGMSHEARVEHRARTLGRRPVRDNPQA